MIQNTNYGASKTYVDTKVEKLTTSGLKAYTHDGATQGETSVVDGTTANSIGVRDANGRMQAADPASGATDKTLVTSNWVSQSGDAGPNNLIHKIGDETKRGKFTIRTGGTVALFNIEHTGVNLNNSIESVQNISYVKLCDTNGLEIGSFMFQRKINDSTAFYVHVRNSDGTYSWVLLATGT